MSVGAIVLAAGQGTRMRSRRPKVLHALAGRSMLGWVLAALREGGVERTVAVLGHGADEVAATLPAGAETRCTLTLGGEKMREIQQRRWN